MTPQVLAVHLRHDHSFSKDSVDSIELLAGLGVRGDAHCGTTVKHRSRVAKDPTQLNLRQVHLLHSELFAEVKTHGLHLEPGQLGENITTQGVDLLGLSEDTELQIGPEAIVRLTGLRNPCAQIENFQPGLLAAVLDRTTDGDIIRKAGVMGVVVRGGFVRPNDEILIAHSPNLRRPLRPV